MRAWQKARAERQWPEALDLLIGAFRSGLNTEAALAVFYHNAPEPLRSELHRRAEGGWKWRPVEKKIAVLFSDPDLMLVQSALLLSLDQGGQHSRLLEAASRFLRGKREFEDRVHGLTAHARLTAWIVGLSPVALGFIFATLTPEMARPLLETSQGIWIVSSSASLIAVGLWWVHKMSRIPW